MLNETGTELGFSPWSLGSCDGVRTLKQSGIQPGKGGLEFHTQRKRVNIYQRFETRLFPKDFSCAECPS